LKREADLSLIVIGDQQEEEKKSFNMRSITDKKKKKTDKEKSGSFKLDLEDDRWNALQSNHLYGLDPTHPEFKKRKQAMNYWKRFKFRQKEGSKNQKKRKNEIQKTFHN